jgi:hypothetical protein
MRVTRRTSTEGEEKKTQLILEQMSIYHIYNKTRFNHIKKE